MKVLSNFYAVFSISLVTTLFEEFGHVISVVDNHFSADDCEL